jgi:hypothetical protein
MLGRFNPVKKIISKPIKELQLDLLRFLFAML